MLKKFFGWFITIFFCLLLFWKFRYIDSAKVTAAVKSINPSLFIAGIALMVLSAWLQAVRWKIILSPLGNYSSGSVFGSVVIGHWFNVVLPARMGELLKPLHFSKKHNLPYAKVLATCVTERVSDAIAILLLAALCMGLVWGKGQISSLLAGFMLYVALLFSVYIIARFKHKFAKLPTITISKNITLPLGQMAHDFFDSLTFNYTPKIFTGISVVTLGLWLVNVLSYWLLIMSCSLPLQLQDIKTGAFVTLASVVGHTVPSSASGLGILNYCIIIVLEVCSDQVGINKHFFSEQFFTASLVIYFAAILPDVVIGGYVYFKDRKYFQF